MESSTLLLILGGFVALVVGGESLIRGASRLATAIGISPLVVGLTIVSLGTSAPELAVSLKASLQGSPAIAIGNVAGSNIFNILFVLGFCAAIAPLTVKLQLARLDVPVMAAVSVLLTAMAWNGSLARWEAATLLAGCIVYTGVLIRLTRLESKSGRADFEKEFGEPPGKRGVTVGAIARNLAFIAVGSVLLVLGADWLVAGAVTMARGLGISEAVIGLTIVAIGTSLPEVVTSVVATIKNERDIAVGNVVGSNIYNILLILGVSGTLSPDGLAVETSLARTDLPFATAVALVCVPVFLIGKTIHRAVGFVFFGAYVAYTAYLIIHA